MSKIISPEDKSAQAVVNRSRLKFSDIGILPGTELTFTEDSSKRCKVIDDRAVEYEGRRFDSLADLAREICDGFSDRWDSAPMLFAYQGDTLADIRKRLESDL